jgi:hypothetical protein
MARAPHAPYFMAVPLLLRPARRPRSLIKISAALPQHRATNTSDPRYTIQQKVTAVRIFDRETSCKSTAVRIFI